uniref:Solute carrier family 22 member 3 n=1 Tax=Scleropages formosus TaxID=113540 RepID=A0A8C9SSJ8_SCLFO
MTTFDDILEETGKFGLCQKRIFGLLCLVSMPFAGVYVGIVFQGFTPEHWCRDPGLNQLSENCGWGQLETRRHIVSLVNDSADAIHAQCERYEVDWNDTGLACEVMKAEFISISFSRAPVLGCKDGWEYDYEGRTSFVTEFDLVCGNSWMVDMFQSMLNVGFLAGSIVMGYLADRFGRKMCFLLSNLLNGVAGILVAISPNYIALLVFRVLYGFGVKGGWVTAYVLITELVGVEYRRMVGVLLQMFFSVGILILPLIAYLIPNWRWLQVAITVKQFYLIQFIPESPRWLLSQNNIRKAVHITGQIAKENGKTLSKNIETLTGDNTDITTASFLDLIRTPKMRKYTFILMFNWFTSAVVYQGLIMRLGIQGGNVYVDFLISGVVEFPAAFLILFTIERIGRRIPFATANIVSGVACFVVAFTPDSLLWFKMFVACIGRLGITMAFEMVVFVNTELYPTFVRNLGVSACSTLCDIGGIVAPFLLYRLAVIWLELPLIIFGVIAFVAGALVLMLPETKGVPLPETIDDIEFPNRKKESPGETQPMMNLLSTDVTAVVKPLDV